MKIANADAIIGLNAILAGLNANGGGSIDIMDGAIPADVSVAVTGQNLLGTVVLSTTAFPTAIDAVGNAQATANDITDGTAGTAGTAAWFRARDGNGVARIDGTAGESGAELLLTDETYEVNDNIEVASWVVILPE
jgi:hypothetical protein